mmetsp:Transcript_3270/g.9277  ORF Transcript_3270/g.9277 Transcript_3270/m.9277 type:complete len:227 (+) Transcript_3270:689-1369(+)
MEGLVGGNMLRVGGVLLLLLLQGRRVNSGIVRAMAIGDDGWRNRACTRRLGTVRNMSDGRHGHVRVIISRDGSDRWQRCHRRGVAVDGVKAASAIRVALAARMIHIAVIVDLVVVLRVDVYQWFWRHVIDIIVDIVIFVQLIGSFVTNLAVGGRGQAGLPCGRRISVRDITSTRQVDWFREHRERFEGDIVGKGLQVHHVGDAVDVVQPIHHEGGLALGAQVDAVR